MFNNENAMEPIAHMLKNEFETGFLSISVKKRVLNCDTSDLAPVFNQWLPNNQPILEAGAGPGIWCEWFVRNGWETIGLEWSSKLCTMAKAEVPAAYFISGDMRSMPFEEGFFGAIVALGSIEHVPEGPATMLMEFKRVLRHQGISVITVPYYGPLRKALESISTPVRKIKNNMAIRKFFGKPALKGKTLKQASQEVSRHWQADFHYGEDGWHFYQYQFTAKQMRSLLNHAGLTIIDELKIMADSGIFNSLGRIAAHYDPDSGRVTLSGIGRAVKKILGHNAVGHMLCYVVQKR